MENLKLDLYAAKSLIKLMAMMAKDKNKLNDDVNNNYAICKYISTKLINGLNVDLQVMGLENIPKEEQTLITPNHRGFFDILLLLSIVDRPTSFATAKELYSIPVLKDYIESINCISIDRETTDFDIIKKQMADMVSAIKSGCNVVFPEGCANHYDDEIGEFKKGGFIGASKLDSYIVPTYIDLGQTKNLAQWLVPTEKIVVSIGQAFKPSDISDKKLRPNELAEYTREQVLTLKKQIG